MKHWKSFSLGSKGAFLDIFDTLSSLL